jgi:hypothetical protein
MSSHDQFCRCTDPNANPVWCTCDEIAKVRADERAQYQGRRDDMVQALSTELLNVRTDLRAKVEALPPENVYAYRGPVVLRADVLALLDGGSE